MTELHWRSSSRVRALSAHETLEPEKDVSVFWMAQGREAFRASVCRCRSWCSHYLRCQSLVAEILPPCGSTLGDSDVALLFGREVSEFVP